MNVESVWMEDLSIVWKLFTHPLFIFFFICWLVFATSYYIYTGYEQRGYRWG